MPTNSFTSVMGIALWDYRSRLPLYGPAFPVKLGTMEKHMRKLYALPIVLLALSAVPAHADYVFSITFKNSKLVSGTANTKELCLQEVGRNVMIHGSPKPGFARRPSPALGFQRWMASPNITAIRPRSILVLS
jgi:hypothetical protein